MIDKVSKHKEHWYLYLIRTLDNKLYCGISHDPVVRFYQHCTGRGAKFFNSSKAEALVYIEPCESKSQALKRELAIKQFSKALKEQLIISAPVTYLLPLFYNQNKQLTLADIKL